MSCDPPLAPRSHTSAAWGVPVDSGTSTGRPVWPTGLICVGAVQRGVPPESVDIAQTTSLPKLGAVRVHVNVGCPFTSVARLWITW